MVASFVQLNTGTGGSKAQTVQNTIGGNVVDANAVVLHDAAGLPITTLPVSLAAAPTTPVTGTFWQATQPVSIAAAVPVTQATLTKGTQGATGVTTQDLKDAGRTPIVLSAAGVTSVITTAALMSMNIYKAGVVTTATTYQVTAGKTFRLQAIQFGSRFITPSTTVTFASVTFALRFLTATGTLLVTSPILLQDSKLSASNTPTPNSDLAVPDGLEIPGGYVFGITQLASAATLALDAMIVGYEY